jgi:3'5'-cyclic nucleotide phosphodiesterase
MLANEKCLTALLNSLNLNRNWMTPRSDKIECKGKGVMTTFWCEPRAAVTSESIKSSSEVSPQERELEPSEVVRDVLADKAQRLIDWNVDMLTELMVNVVAEAKSQSDIILNPSPLPQHSEAHPVDEVTDVLMIPEEAINSEAKGALDPMVRAQLRELVASVEGLYHAHPFHNFEHACHVSMSTMKLLKRIDLASNDSKGGQLFGGKSVKFDALTQFAIVFGALIHDIDHPGVSNSQLVKEQHAMALTYDGRSVAEQNSISLAWQLFMQSQFEKLRTSLCPTPTWLKRFRQIIVNVVMATDLFDKELKAMRDACWEASFNNHMASTNELLTGDDLKRRKTIVVQLIIQASDVSHTMQHFTIYKVWNMNLLKEMYHAYQNGRLAKDPTVGWYEGELWFFDNYVIPLAQQLRECKVFGVSCDEFLDYAKDNRMEWEMKGREIVRQAAVDMKACELSEKPLEI